MKDWWNHYWPF